MPPPTICWEDSSRSFLSYPQNDNFFPSHAVNVQFFNFPLDLARQKEFSFALIQL
jgi:hypothetical protein